MKRAFRSLICMLIVILTAAAAFPTGAEEAPERKIIIDTDTGADDASAIILAAMSDQVEIVGVTVLVGNVPLEQSVDNALMALEMAGMPPSIHSCTVPRPAL